MTLTQQDQYTQAMNDHVGVLMGATVVKCTVVPLDDEWPDELWTVLHLRTADGMTLEVAVSQDEEGNGPGHLFIERIQ
jgi:hypothetical protein